MNENSDFSHNIYKSDPLLFKSYVGMKANILTENGNTISGIVYTVDPVSESVVLLQRCSKNDLTVVFGHAIKNIEICPEERIDLPELFTNTSNILQSTLEERKNAVIKMLQENRFPVKQENDILIIEDVLQIKPLYASNDCVCSNSIILGRIQSLLTQMES
ncbi:gem-associated protein 6 [Calliopsis andreniformis]|uniref:gem-associated protein 6 n=1 Tax=Calliopsis andreniformis TaxID=337506 RepID=UPI003FCC2855